MQGNSYITQHRKKDSRHGNRRVHVFAFWHLIRFALGCPYRYIPCTVRSRENKKKKFYFFILVIMERYVQTETSLQCYVLALIGWFSKTVGLASSWWRLVVLYILPFYLFIFWLVFWEGFVSPIYSPEHIFCISLVY